MGWGTSELVSVGDEPGSFGTVIAQDTQIAWFAIENMGQAPIEIKTTRFDSDLTAGDWLEPVRWERDASGAHSGFAHHTARPREFGIWYPFQAFLPADASPPLSEPTTAKPQPVFVPHLATMRALRYLENRRTPRSGCAL